MLITYVIFLLIAVTFKVLHWPGASLILLAAPLFLLIDILIQAIRKKGDKETRILSAIAALFVSFFFLFKFLHWPGSSFLFILSSLLSVVYLLRFYQKKIKTNLRFVLLSLLFIFSVVNFSMKPSTFTLFYLCEDPFDKEEYVPHFLRQSLAFELYQEGDYAKAEQLIQLNIDHLNLLIEEEDGPDYYREIDRENLEISKNDLVAIQKRSWLHYERLFPEDRTVSLY
jgi:hypothetical protein